MPIPGSITTGVQIGQVGKFYIWAKCPTCSVFSWRGTESKYPNWRTGRHHAVGEDGITTLRNCQKCAPRLCATKTPPGTTRKTGPGYVWILLAREDPYYNTRSSGWVAQHRYEMMKHLKRKLRKGENVHHKNGVRDDNRIENLELWIRTQPSGIKLEDVVVEYLNSLSAKEVADLLRTTVHANRVRNRPKAPI